MICLILISELGFMIEVFNICMEILIFLVKRKEKKDKVDFLIFRIVLYVLI